MVSLTLHVIKTRQDALDFEEEDSSILFIDEEHSCDSCDAVVGFDDGLFYPCVVVIADDDEWPVCLDCADGVLP